MKEHLDFLKTLYTFCFNRGYIIDEGSTVEEKKNTKTGQVEVIIKCAIRCKRKNDEDRNRKTIRGFKTRETLGVL